MMPKGQQSAAKLYLSIDDEGLHVKPNGASCSGGGGEGALKGKGKLRIAMHKPKY